MSGEQGFLQEHFRQYYKSHAVDTPEVEAREFGIGDFGKKITKRHISFKDNKELNAFLSAVAPFYISYSAALYKQPSKTPMAAKEFFAADLIYEFDADDIKTVCKKKHDCWECPECKKTGSGSIENCTGCGARVRLEQWFCGECLDETKKQVFRLLEFLEKDFGFTEGISINFSGNAGYHVHIRNAAIRDLSHAARIELLDYLTANTLLPENHGFFVQDKRLYCPNPKTALGWGKRIISGLTEMIEKENALELASFGHASVKRVEAFLKRKQDILDAIQNKCLLVSSPGKSPQSFWLSLVNHVVQKHALKLDRQTSMDSSKIIRVPGTLHGSTGLSAKKVSLEQLSAFQPLDDSVAFESNETVKVFINKSPRFYLRGEWFGGFEKTSVELPLAAAIYLTARKAAVLEKGLGNK